MSAVIITGMICFTVIVVAQVLGIAAVSIWKSKHCGSAEADPPQDSDCKSEG